MKKVAAVAVSIGVILVIVGLVMVGIFGGEALKQINWKDIFSGTNHDLSKAKDGIDTNADDLNELETIEIQVDRYSVYVLPTDDNKISVKYVGPLEEGVTVDVVCYDVNPTKLYITEKDNLGSWHTMTGSNRFIVVYVPQTEQFTSTILNVTAKTAGVKVQDVTFASVKCDANTGGINIDKCNVNNITLQSKTGSVNINDCTCHNLNIDVNTGSVNINKTIAIENVDIEVNTGSVNCYVNDIYSDIGKSIKIDVDTGSVNFKVKADKIEIVTDTGSVNGTVMGSKSSYQISVSQGTGKSNLGNQTLSNPTKYLTVEVDTGSINVTFSDY